MIHFKCSHFMRKSLWAEFPKMELLCRKVCKIILGRKKKNNKKQKLKNIKTKKKTQLLKNWYFITGDLFYLHWNTLLGYSKKMSQASGFDQGIFSLSTEASVSQLHTKNPFKRRRYRTHSIMLLVCFGLGRKFPPGLWLMCLYLLLLCGHAWSIRIIWKLSLKLFPSPCKRLGH